MATYNTVNFASDNSTPSVVAGLATSDARYGVTAQDAKFNYGNDRTKVIPFDLTLQALGTADTLQLCVLPKGTIPLSFPLFNTVAFGSGVAVTLGAIQNGVTTGTYFSAAAITLGTTTHLRTELFTNAANIGKELAAETTVILTNSTAALGSTSQLVFVPNILTN